MDTNALRQLGDRIRTLVSQEPFMKEANVKLRIVQPLLSALEWDVTGGEVEMERTVRVGSKSPAVDFALIADGKPVVFIETKSFDSSLAEEQAQQTISYGRVEGVRWCVLTNGKELRVYDATEGMVPQDCIVSAIDLTNLEGNFDEIRLLARNSLLAQELESVVGARRSLRTAAKRLEGERTEIAIAIGKVLKNHLPDLPGDRIRDLAEKALSRVQAEILQAQFRSEQATAPPEPLARVSIRPEVHSDVPVVARRELRGNPDANVLVCSARSTGLPFFLRYQAWGYPRTRIQPDFVALYLTSPQMKVSYIGEVESMTPPLSSRAEVKGIAEEDKGGFAPGKRVIWLQKGSIRKLSDPIPAGRVGSQPQSPRSTTLRKFMAAKDTGDLWEK